MHGTFGDIKEVLCGRGRGWRLKNKKWVLKSLGHECDCKADTEFPQGKLIEKLDN